MKYRIFNSYYGYYVLEGDSPKEFDSQEEAQTFIDTTYAFLSQKTRVAHFHVQESKKK